MPDPKRDLSRIHVRVSDSAADPLASMRACFEEQTEKD
jgi:hypothetical protein